MGYPSALGKLWIKRQAGGAGVAESSFSDVTDILNTEKFLMPTKVQVLLSEYLRGNYHAHLAVPGSREGNEFPIKKKLSGFSATTPTANPTEFPDAVLLKALLGGSSIAGYSATALAGGIASAINYTDGQLSAALSGHGVLVPYSGGRGWVWAKTINTASAPDVLTPACPLAAAPSGSGVIYGGNTLYLSADAPELFTTQWRGGNANAAVRARDCVPLSCKLTFQAGQQPTSEYQIRVGYPDPGVGGGAPALYSVPWPDLPMIAGVNGGRYYSVEAGAVEAVPKIEIDIRQSVEPRGDVNALDGFLGYDVTDREVIVTVESLSANIGSEFKTVGAETDAIQIDLCTTPGRAWSALIRNAQIREWEHADENGVVKYKRVYHCRPTAGDTAGGNPAGSAFRLVYG